MEKKSKAVDRLSELPEPVLHHILKRLPFKEVARTCVLSKTWERVWGTYPIFEFDDYIIRKHHYYDDKIKPHRKIEPAEKKFRAIDCLEQTLRNRLCKGFVNMEELVFNIDVGGFSEDLFVKRCLCYAIASNVKRLNLAFNRKRYDLPLIVLCSNSVEVLNLRGCNIRMPITDWKMSSLTRLIMSSVCLDDFVCKSILAGCPLLGKLRLDSCKGLRILELFDHEKLDEIGIHCCEVKRVNIKGMNISSLNVGQRNPFVIDVTNCKNLEKLKLKRPLIKDNRLSNLISELLMLKYLSLEDCADAEKFNISSASLKILEVKCDWDGFVDLEMDTPSLNCFTYSGVVINLYSNARALSKIELCIWNLATLGNYVRFVKFISQFHGCSAMLNLAFIPDFISEQVFIAAEELRHELPPPLFSYPGVIRLQGCLPSLSMAKLIDEFLWIFSHTKTLRLNFNEGIKDLAITCEFSYKKPLAYVREHISCCKSVPLLCWKECIEKVDVSIRSGEQGYCFQGAEFLEEIDRLCTNIIMCSNL